MATLGDATLKGLFLFLFASPKVAKASTVTVLLLTVLLTNFTNVNDPLGIIYIGAISQAILH